MPTPVGCQTFSAKMVNITWKTWRRMEDEWLVIGWFMDDGYF
jgi:hypothetical protein